MGKQLRQPIQVVIYPARLAGAEWEYLLLHRTNDKPTQWQGIIAEVGQQEDLLVAATRALLSHTGLAAGRLKMVGYSTIFPMEDDWQKDYVPGTEFLTEYVIAAFVDTGQEPKFDGKIYDDFRWTLVNQARKLIQKHSHYEALLQCDDFVRARD